MNFEPIAIVGRGCVFPEAFTPAALWGLVRDNRDVISACSEGRWRASKDAVLGDGPDRAWTDRGGYVRGFPAVFDTGRFAISSTKIQPLDEGVQWALYAARNALAEAGLDNEGNRGRTGAIIGQLGLPSESMAQYAEEVWRGLPPSISPRNRFLSGSLIETLVEGLSLNVETFALDAACASSLYAIKLACDALHDGVADVMLAGGVNRADDLFLHIGFTALKAISRSGSSRPFHLDADGLVPAEGAGFVALKRLHDAEAHGNRILTVIRSIGLSNDGRSAGLLTPSERGQEQAMRKAYIDAEMEPAMISLLECHATGTPVGDVCEIRSSSRVFDGTRDTPIGSVKSNLGHPITAAGMAGLLKLIGAIEHRIRPASLHVSNPVSAIAELADSPFRLLLRNEPWNCRDIRRAALSGFGFGGNNAHLILEEYSPSQRVSRVSSSKRQAAVVSLAASAGDAHGIDQVTRAIFLGKDRGTRLETISLDFGKLSFPPADLESALPQQVLALQVASDATESVSGLDAAKTGVFVGMACDAEVARYGLRWRALAQHDVTQAEADEICPPLTAAGVIGRLANIVANRIQSKYDLRGPGLAVMSEEQSGIVALRLAVRAIAAGELDAAVVGAVDLSCEPVHQSTADCKCGDAAVFLVLKRADLAGPAVMGIAESTDADALSLDFTALQVFGHAQATSRLLDATAAMLACRHGALIPARPWIAPRGRRAKLDSPKTRALSITTARSALPLLTGPPPSIFVYSGENSHALLKALRAGAGASKDAGGGPARLAIVAASEQELTKKRERAMQDLETGQPAVSEEGLFYRAGPVNGKLALVFPGAAGAYLGMGSSFLLAFPDLLETLSEWCPRLTSAASWIYQDRADNIRPSDRLWASSMLAQAHARFVTQTLGIRPDAAIGISSGETNSLAALGVWRDLDLFFEEFMAAGALDRVLGGNFEITGGVPWQAWQVRASLSEIKDLLEKQSSLRLTGAYAPDEFSIAGPSDLFTRALGQLRSKAQPTGYDLVIHCEEFLPYAERWLSLHDRKSCPAPVELYSHSFAGRYEADRCSIAKALTDQASKPLDFPSLIRRAWEDGVRVFLELGPQGACSSWIHRILGQEQNEYAAFPMDLARVDSLRQAANAVAQLAVTGVNGADCEVFDRFRDEVRPAPQRSFTVPAHASPVRLPERRTPKLFETHVRALSESYATFLNSCGSESHEAFLETSRRAFLQLAGRLRESPQVAHAQQRLTRRDLELLASGPVSPVLGPEFKRLDTLPRLVRLPTPPLLLVDRVATIEGRALSMQTGAITTETDVRSDAWYMHRGRMPAGLTIEAGQADLLLISWLGIDLEVRGDRIYRLLGCDLTYHRELPHSGETLRYDIRIDGHAKQGDVRLFFFHYDCHIGEELFLSVRNGQAGFFSDEELQHSAGVIGAPEPPHQPRPVNFSPERVAAAAAGRVWECFGDGFKMAAAHQRSPGFASPRMLLLNRVTHLSVHEGKQRPGYLRAELPIRPDLWFFDGHFKDDPCMPGTLMFEGCLQAMAFYMMALKLTLEHDAWRFEPVPDRLYPLRCRGQVTPHSRELTYELFVEEVISAPEPRLTADLVCTVDGLKAFHCRCMGLRLTPGFPIDDEPSRTPVPTHKEVARVNGIPLDYPALLACAWGSPVDAFGPPFQKFIATRLPRLPGPPYHFVTRFTRVEGQFGVPKTGSRAVAEYEVDPDAWFFRSAGSQTMPLAVLTEIALQPCGWLASYTGIPLRAAESLYFRNLDGSAVIERSVPRTKAVIVTETTLASVANSAGITLTSFEVICLWNNEPLLRMQTIFGFFRAEDLASQNGLPPTTSRHPARLPEASINLRSQPGRYFDGLLRMPSGDLLMLDRITALQPPSPDGGWVRAEKSVLPPEWFFKAHFFQDPVQPGSLGLDALLQAVQFYVIHYQLAEGIVEPEFGIESPLVWKYRGQVLPENRRIAVEVKLKTIDRTHDDLRVRAEGWLFADDIRIYHFADFGLRVVTRTIHAA